MKIQNYLKKSFQARANQTLQPKNMEECKHQRTEQWEDHIFTENAVQYPPKQQQTPQSKPLQLAFMFIVYSWNRGWHCPFSPRMFIQCLDKWLDFSSSFWYWPWAYQCWAVRYQHCHSELWNGSGTKFSVLWFLSTVLSLVWRARQTRVPLSFPRMKATIGAEIAIMKKTRYISDASILESALNFSIW